MRFLELYLKGDVLEEDIHRFVEDWHEGREGAGMETARVPRHELGRVWGMGSNPSSPSFHTGG